MTNPSAHQRALDAFELDDIFVVELTCKIARDFNQTANFSVFRMQHRFEPLNTGVVQTRKQLATEQDTMVFRYYVEGEVRVIKPEVPEEKTEFDEDDILASIGAIIAVDYLSTKDLREDLDAIGAFGSNVVFHAYPYWRSAVICRAAELRLPRIVLPMMRQAKKAAIELESQTADTTQSR